MFFWAGLRTVWPWWVFSLYRKPQEGSLADCGEQGSGQEAEAHEARDDGSLKMARGVNIASHKAFHLLSFLLTARVRPTTYISCTSRIGHAGRKLFGKIQVKVFPWKCLMILGHRTKRSEVLALPHFKRSRSEKWKTTNVGLEVFCWGPPLSLSNQSASGTSQKSFLIASLLHLEVPLTSFYSWKTRK